MDGLGNRAVPPLSERDSPPSLYNTPSQECAVLMPEDLDSQQQLDFCTAYLYGRWGLKIAQGMGDGEYSPYRVYINNVLTQASGYPDLDPSSPWGWRRRGLDDDDAGPSGHSVGAFVLRWLLFLYSSIELQTFIIVPSLTLPACPRSHCLLALAPSRLPPG